MQILNVSITGGLNLELTPSFVFLSTNVPTIVEGNTFTIDQECIHILLPE
jgi:hypothetical protein